MHTEAIDQTSPTLMRHLRGDAAYFYSARRTSRIVLAASALCLLFVFSARADEKQWIGVLQSDAAPAEKAMACKRLAIEGSKDAVPALAPLLKNPELNSWARIALEVIPDPSADEALRSSLPSLDSPLVIGVINSIGVRRDAQAVDALAEYLTSSDLAVVSSAAASLGKIGTDAAIDRLSPLLDHESQEVRSAVAEGCVYCAERLMADGNGAGAAALYDRIRMAQVSRPRIQEATRGAILARGNEGIPLLLEQLSSPDKGLFQIGLGVARELPGAAVTEAIAAHVARVSVDRQPLLVLALADRSDDNVLATVTGLAKAGPAPVRVAALQVIGQKGNVASLPALFQIVVETEPAVHAAAKQALQSLPSGEVDRQLSATLAQAKGLLRLALIELAGQRRIETATESLLTAIRDADAPVRAAAYRALGETVPQKDLKVLVDRVLSGKDVESDEYQAAEDALRSACIRMPDREACAGELTAAMAKANSQSKRIAIEILGQMGGSTALQTVASVVRDKDVELADTASRQLGEWMTADAAPVLLDLVKTAPAARDQLRALRGYLRIARQFILPDEERTAMCQAALQVAKRDEERRLVLEILQRYPTVEGLQLVANLSKLQSLREPATQVAVTMAQKLQPTPRVAELLTQMGHKPVKVEIVKAEYGGNGTYRDVTEALRQHVGNLAFIALPSGYNGTLGGDPAPGVPKELKIQYKIDDQAGEVTFPENAPIVLPTK